MAVITNEKRGLKLLDHLQPLLLLSAIAVGLVLARLRPALATKLTSLATAGVFIVIYFIRLGV